MRDLFLFMIVEREGLLCAPSMGYLGALPFFCAHADRVYIPAMLSRFNYDPKSICAPLNFSSNHSILKCSYHRMDVFI